MVILCVTTIQIGTKECAIAHQPRGDNEKPSRVIAQTLHGNDRVQISFPSSLLISIKGSLAVFGFSAVEKYNDTKDGIFFENIIESLYYSEGFNEKTLIKDSTGTTHNALYVISEFLKAVFENTKTFFDSEFKGDFGKPVFEVEGDIKWVLALPSVRADKAVSFFIKGWEKIGLSEDMFTTVTYPNAVLNYCLYLPPEECNGTSFDKLHTGERVMVIGFEDELDSINVYEKLENQSFKQVVNHLSGTGSIDAITDAFDIFFSDLFGSWIWKVAKNNNESILSTLVSNFDFINSQLGSTNTTNKGPDIRVTGDFGFSTKKKTGLAIRVPRDFGLTETCEEHINMNWRQSLEQSEYASQVRLIGDKMRIDSNLITSIFNKILKKIIHSITFALTRSEGKEVSTIILAGNIANYSMMKCAIEEEFPNKNIFAIKQAELAALKGACMFGHKPIVVSSIFCGAQVMVIK